MNTTDMVKAAEIRKYSEFEDMAKDALRAKVGQNEKMKSYWNKLQVAKGLNTIDEAKNYSDIYFKEIDVLYDNIGTFKKYGKEDKEWAYGDEGYIAVLDQKWAAKVQKELKSKKVKFTMMMGA